MLDTRFWTPDNEISRPDPFDSFDFAQDRSVPWAQAQGDRQNWCAEHSLR
ncbi:MAG: hypothetical protein PVH77_08215 [Phycisphaerales bacterium]